MTAIVLSDIYIYPIKSLGGIRLDSWPVTKTGFKYDRQWMLVNEESHFLSQRSLPRMVLIGTAIQGDTLVLSAPNRANLALELEPKQGEILPCTIWDNQVETLAISPDADRWFSEFLQTSCRLVYLPDETIRHVNPDYAQPNDQTTLSDGFPFLLVSESSLTFLNKAMHMNMEMRRFRPNLVIAGSPSFAEDTWRDITIGNIDFRLPKPCSRCSVPTINLETGETGKEPLATLNRLRKWENKVYFGQNAIHNDCGVLSVGDSVHINLSGPQQPPLN